MKSLELIEARTPPPIVGESNQLQALKRLLPRVAAAQRTTLVYGPTGTGKELVVRHLHDLSPRRCLPLVVVHCGAIPDKLFESELYGHKQGAFTGATRERSGLVAEAGEGVLFLDEINSLSLHAQTRLLRFLENGEYRPVGGDVTRRSRAWIIAASNERLEEAAEDQRFRLDLLHRLQLIRLEVPALVERGDDMLLLAQHFLHDLGCADRRFTPAAHRALLAHRWPGNVRELRNRVEAAVLLADSELVDASNLRLSDALRGPSVPSPRRSSSSLQELLWLLVDQQGMDLNEVLRGCERVLIESALEAEEGNRTRAAARLGIHVRTIFKKLALPA